MLDSLTLPFGPMADKIHAKPLQNLSLKKSPPLSPFERSTLATAFLRLK